MLGRDKWGICLVREPGMRKERFPLRSRTQLRFPGAFGFESYHDDFAPHAFQFTVSGMATLASALLFDPLLVLLSVNA
jgi:hypothetical protein